MVNVLGIIKKAGPNWFGFLAGEEGLEPPLTVLETAALPLYYSPRSLTDELYCSILISVWQAKISNFPKNSYNLFCKSKDPWGIPWVFRLCKRGIFRKLLISSLVSQPNKQSITKISTKIYKYFDEKAHYINIKYAYIDLFCEKFYFSIQ